MGYIGKSPPPSALTASDISDGIISEAKLATNSVSEVKMADDAISLTELKAGTDGEIISWDASGNQVAIGAGTSGHFLKSQGASSKPVFAEAGGGAWNYLSTTTISNDATVDITSNIDSTYDVYAFIGTQILPATGGQHMDMRYYIGGSFASSSDYHWTTHDTNTNNTSMARAGANDGNAIRLTRNDTPNTTAYTSSFQMFLHKPSSTSTYKNIHWTALHWINSVNCVSNVYGAGSFDANTTAVTGVQFFQSSGNLTSGTIRLYGLSNS